MNCQFQHRELENTEKNRIPSLLSLCVLQNSALKHRCLATASEVQGLRARLLKSRRLSTNFPSPHQNKSNPP